MGQDRVGKTTPLKNYLSECKEKYLYVTGEDVNVREYMESQSLEKLRDFVGTNKLLAVDEAQHVQKIGLNLKLIADNVPDIKIIATGSSSFEIAKGIGGPMTDRKLIWSRKMPGILMGMRSSLETKTFQPLPAGGIIRTPPFL